MADLIERQEVLNLIDHYINWAHEGDAQEKHSVLFIKGMEDGYFRIRSHVLQLPSAKPDITDAQAIDHLQATGWMPNHDHEMYMKGIRERLADDSGSYDSLIPPEQRWIPISERLPEFGHRVLFKMWNNDVHIGILLKLNDGLKITLGATGIGYVYSFENVIAWMSLPE